MRRTTISIALMLTACASVEPQGSLYRMSKPKGFLYESSTFQNASRPVQGDEVFAICGAGASQVETCGTAPGTRYFGRREDVARTASPAQWILGFIERQPGRTRMRLIPPRDSSVLAGLHPLVSLASEDSSHGLQVLMTPVVPDVIRSEDTLDAGENGAIAYRRNGDFQTDLLIPEPALLGAHVEWLGPNLLEIRTKRSFSSPAVVVIDAGHGAGSGASVEGIIESDWTLKAALELSTMLGRDPRIKTVLTRDERSDPTLEERVAVAERSGADLLVSLHLDSWPADPTRLLPNTGTTIYYQTGISRPLASDLCLGLRTSGGSCSWVAHRSLYALHSMAYPSVLVELANLQEPSERDSVRDTKRWSQMIDRLARSITRAVHARQNSSTSVQPAR